jgi:hypothetical protein
MKQTLKNCDVILTCDRPVKDGDVMLGVGCLKRARHQFLFEKMCDVAYRKNPRVFKGKYWSVRSTRLGFRFTGIVSPNLLSEMGTTALIEAMSCEVREAAAKLEMYLTA